MRTYQRLCYALAREGAMGLVRRKLLDRGRKNGHAAQERERALAEYDQLVREFKQGTAELGFKDLEAFYWYHTIDLGNGIVTPGAYDYRTSLSAFHFPEDMSGMSVLDVGSATGFFSFEFERRGAEVVAVELPSIAQWDMPLEEREQTLQALLDYHRTESLAELTFRHLEGPFQFCKKMLNSKVKRCHSKIYDLSAATLGRDGFDLVFLGDILLHTFSPLAALVSVAPLCRKTLIIAQTIPADLGPRPVMQFLGGANDSRSWWEPNLPCLEEMLQRLAFASVRVMGQHRGIVRPDGFVYNRTILHATRAASA